MCHRCNYTGSFVLDYHALYLQHFMYRIEIPYPSLFRNGSVHEFYRSKALITLEQVITSVIEKKNNLNKQNFEVTGKSGSRIEDRLKKNLKIK